jgi:dihydroorotate dehydrogenase (fumarate)
MADLSTTYMGLKLASPLVVGACSLSKYVDRIKAAEDNGAGALVIKSLFEEQIELERTELEEALNVGADYFQEAQSYFPDLEHAGPDQHLYWIEKARKAVSMPLIASLNAAHSGTWLDWAKQLEETGIDGIELNVFSLGNRAECDSNSLEAEILAIVEAVADKVQLPVSVKLSPYITGVAHLAEKLDKLGVRGLVLFNRFFLPDIDTATEKVIQKLVFSTQAEGLVALRWIGLLHGRLLADLAASTGVFDADDAIKMVLAGARAVQVASTLYKHGVDHLRVMNDGLAAWMDAKGYQTIEDFRGKLSRQKMADPYAFERAQYIKLLLGFD